MHSTETDRSETASDDAYTHGHHPSVLRSHAWRTVANSAAYLIPHLRPGARILDVGSGPGTITLDLAGRVAPGEVIGLDSSADVIAHANGLATDNGRHNVRFVTGDAYHLDFEDDSFDIVHAHQVLQHLSRPREAMAEFRRVLKPGGVLAARDADYGGVIAYPELPGLRRWLEVNHDVYRWNQGEPDAGRRIAHWAREAGFGSVESSASIWLFSTEPEREWWGGSWAERALESSFASHAIEAGVAELADLQAISEAWREWAASPDGWFAIPHGEIIARA